jgi:hypothetical protein
MLARPRIDPAIGLVSAIPVFDDAESVLPATVARAGRIGDISFSAR